MSIHTTASSPGIGSARIGRLVDEAEFPVLGTAIATASADGVWRQSHGLADVRSGVPVGDETVFAYGSFTKVLTAALVCQLAEAGRIGVDAEIRGYLPEARLPGVTVRMLLAHTAGIVDLFEPFASVDALIRTVADSAPLAPPGAGFSYSNPGYVLLGRLVEEVSGAAWEDRLRQCLLAPLGIDRVTASPADAAIVAGPHLPDPATGGFRPHPMWPDVGPVFDAAGSRLHGTATDAARLALAIAGGRVRGASGPLLRPDTVAEMLRPQAAVPGTGVMATHWCLGWALLTRAGDRPVHAHQGGTSVMVAVSSDRGEACAVLANCPHGMKLGRRVVGALWDADLPAPAFPPAGGVDGMPTAAFAGRYGSRTFELAVRQEGGGLRMSNPLGGDALPLRRVGEREFAVDAGLFDADVVFGPEAGGQPACLHFALRRINAVRQT